MYEDESDWEDLRGQLTSIKTKPGTERVEEICTKKEMKAEGIKSPDMGDGIAMIYATQTPTLVDWTGESIATPLLIESSIHSEAW